MNNESQALVVNTDPLLQDEYEYAKGLLLDAIKSNFHHVLLSGAAFRQIRDRELFRLEGFKSFHAWSESVIGSWDRVKYATNRADHVAALNGLKKGERLTRELIRLHVEAQMQARKQLGVQPRMIATEAGRALPDVVDGKPVESESVAYDSPVVDEIFKDMTAPAPSRAIGQPKRKNRTDWDYSVEFITKYLPCIVRHCSSLRMSEHGLGGKAKEALYYVTMAHYHLTANSKADIRDVPYEDALALLEKHQQADSLGKLPKHVRYALGIPPVPDHDN